MNGRRRFVSTIGLGFLLAGGTAAAPAEEFATTARAPQTFPPIAPERRTEYKVCSIPAGDSVEDAFNAVAREGFQYAGAVERYGHTEFIFVRWAPLEPVPSKALS
jgi:hypothetical protein